MDIFKGQNLLEFSDQFKTDENCKKYLASIKSGIDYHCLKCNHRACQNRKNFSRQCNICGHIESATALSGLIIGVSGKDLEFDFTDSEYTKQVI